MAISDYVRAVQKGYEDCMLSFTPSSLKVRESSLVIANDLIIAKAKEIHKCLVKALDLNHREVEFIKWEAPSHPFVKVNVDGCAKNNPGPAMGDSLEIRMENGSLDSWRT
ncbi:unnamed protein product [Vicia faba]|uniref:Uncharacterized protein n=1 Tax=Vicia faba TaxID=3906 RepID=A0AAV0YI77_VICFA|nr:unnamed protein product [Vicia faba]